MPQAPMKLELVDPYSPRVEEVWRAIEAKAQPAYFLTWGWMENWLACLPRHEAPRLAVVHHEGEPIGACFVGKRRVRRHGVVPSRALYINATGLEDYDELCLEHNALLAVPDRGASLAALVSLLPGNWDELFLPAMGGHTFEQLESSTLPANVRVMKDREVANYHVDLQRVRGSKEGYVALLGSSTRAQMRKAQRAAGDVDVEIAGDERAALDIYEEMVVLHQRSWRMRGQPGAFADPWFDRFHRRLIARRVRHGDIQLVRVRNKDLTLGCLYNFVSAGRVLFYQCGFGAPADKHVRPGYLCHAHAVDHSAQQGHAVYDFLGGDARYKSSLATDEARLVWGRVQRKRLQFTLEDRARALLSRDRR